MKVWYPVGALVLVAGLLGAGWLNPGTSEESEPETVSHVHGLGVNPADGSLLAATHYGLFRLSGDREAERVGESFRDIMALTVIGPDELLASGHPDVAGRSAGQPPMLGLIRSVDGGASWSSTSLAGEADFHGLIYANGAVYGWNSTSSKFMVSSDLVNWDTRSTIDLASFAVDPASPDHIVGSGRAGLIESTDGGRTWLESGGPAIVLLAWDARGDLWGTDSEGGVWRRDGAEWQQSGSLPGVPQAVLVAGDGIYAAVESFDGRTAIVESTDGGQTWTERYQDPA